MIYLLEAVCVECPTMNSPLRDIHEASIGPSRPKTLLTIPTSGSENSEMNSNYIIRIREQNMGRKLHIRPIPTTPIGSDSVLPAPNHRPGMAMNIPEIVLAQKNPCPTSKDYLLGRSVGVDSSAGRSR